MGFYIQTSCSHHKAEQIAKAYDGRVIQKPASFDEVPVDKALIVTMDNGPFEAAGWAYNRREFEVFTDPTDWRTKRYVLIDRQKAVELVGVDPGN